CSGNPSSPHSQGREASVALSTARAQVAKALNVDISDIVFVSGGTEANNLGTQGVLRLRQEQLPLDSQHVVLSALEHAAVYEPLFSLQACHGLKTSVSPVSSSSGVVELKNIVKEITPSTTLITLMAANNEIGTLQPVKLLGDWLHYKRWNIGNNQDSLEHFIELDRYLSSLVTKEDLKKIHFHVDAVQAFGKIPTEQWLSDGIDSCAITGHKIGALQGVGALFLRRGRKFLPAFLGGSQEKRRRAGTENLPGIVSFGMICEEICQPQWWDNLEILKKKTLFLLKELSGISGIRINTPWENILPNTVNFSVTLTNKKGEDVLVALDLYGICASSGSACSSATNMPSKTLLALGRSLQEAKNAIRLSLSPKTKDEEVSQTIHFMKKILLP
ncbi:MAG: aminotransferase class V-fold PLP-dependent enzyme, partial [Silvanigrellaceae bacterium]|nr:aminotransferase class V-fold PLP-dependent enzyme [Silvanigrellaceae bacterium]